MQGREKFQVWSVAHQQWRTVYVRPEMIFPNVTVLKAYGFKVRICAAP